MEGKAECSARDAQRKAALAWVSGTVSLSGNDEAETPGSMAKPAKSHGETIPGREQQNVQRARGSGELGFCELLQGSPGDRSRVSRKLEEQ